MHCSWKEIEAYRYAEGSLEPQRSRSFADHLPTCAVCRGRVAEAQRVEGLLAAGLTPVAAPVTLASRIAGTVALEREAARSGGRRSWLANWEWPALFRRRAVSLALSGLALIAALSLVSQVVAPGAVAALVRQVLFFVPGLGIEEATEGALVAEGPVSVTVESTTFAVEALVSDGEQTTIKYAIAGLPGGKAGWGEWRGGERPLVLRVDAEREYMRLSQHAGYGGSPEETTIQGEMIFPALPAEVRSVELIVPVDSFVPPAVLPGSDTMTWALSIPLVPPAESSLPAATPQSAAATVEGITLRAAASAVGADRTVILVEGEAEGGALVRTLGRNGADPVDAAILCDEQGREYRRQTEEGEVVRHSQPFSQDLYFQPLAGDAATLTFEVPVVQVMREDAIEVTISIAGRALDEVFALDRTVELAGYPVRLLSARVGHDPSSDDGRLWLYVDVDLGSTVEGRTLAGLSTQRVGGSASMQSYGSRDGEQLSLFGVPLEPDMGEVTIRLANPIVDVEGPWVLTVPVDGRS